MIDSRNAILTLQRNEQQQDGHTDNRRYLDLRVHEVRENDRLQWSDPEEVKEYDGHVEATDVVGQQIHRLADCRLAQRGPRQLQRFAINERAARHADLHTRVQDRHHVGMDDEYIDGGAHDDTGGIQVSVPRINIHGVVVTQQPAQAQRLCHSVDKRSDIQIQERDYL